MSVLITAGLSPQAYRLQRILNVKEVVFTDESQLPEIPGTLSVVLPAHNSASFVHETLKVCLDNRISTIYPLKRGEVLELSKARALFSEYNVMLMIPSDDWLRENANLNSGETDKLAVLKNGILIAGDELQDNFFVQGESGIFCWATDIQNMEYSLYLVDHAGI